MKGYLWALPVGIAAFMIFLFLAYSINNPLGQGQTVLEWPYILVESPHVVAQKSSVDITIAIIDDQTSLNGTILRIVDPSGNQFLKPITNSNRESIRFPNDFIGASTSANGNYTIILYDDSTEPILTSSSFIVVYDPVLTHFTNFIFGNGLAITIGLIASLITLIYQIGSQQIAERDRETEKMNQDIVRKRNEKGKWMLDHSKDYLELTSPSDLMAHYYASLPNPQAFTVPQAQEIVYSAMRFYKAYDNFLQKIGFYYFDELPSEEFLARIDRLIFSKYDEMVGDYSLLRPFFAMSYFQIMNDPNFQSLGAKAAVWLSTGTNAKELFAAHFIHFWLIRFFVNRALIVAYTDEVAVQDYLRQLAKKDQVILQSSLNEVNRTVFTNPQSYYKLFDEQGNLLLRC